MRVSREQAEQNRETVVETAGKLFRENGFDGIGIVDIMKSAGLTHGGFYGQFGSKEHLAAEASARALSKSRERLVKALNQSDAAPLPAIAAVYLTAAHRDNPGQGCAFAALAADAARSGDAVRTTFREGLEAHVDLLSSPTTGLTRDTVLAALSMMVGALTLARAVDDPTLSDDILQAATRAIEHMPKI